MSAEIFLNGRVQLCCGDSLHFLRDQPDCRYDSAVTDPPYALVSIVRRFGSAGAAPVIVPEGGSGAYARASAGFMGKKWDTGDTAHAAAFWAEVYRVLKPGGFLLASSGTRTYHRLACAIEDGGFEIRDMIAWLYGSGFPKSHNVGAGFDKSNGWFDEDEISAGLCSHFAAYHDGDGTALKPALEPIVMARKPLIGTVADNVLEHGCGGINIDGCRIHSDDAKGYEYTVARTMPGAGQNKTGERKQNGVSFTGKTKDGRWPANVVHDGGAEVLAAFPDDLTSGKPAGIKAGGQGVAFGHFNGGIPVTGFGDTGSAARFFYTAKADADDRLGSAHPTVKPVDLMQWLVRLVTPKGGLVLDPFAGTGTTAEACVREGMRCMLIERETEYQADIRRRMALVMAGPETRARESIKAKNFPVDHGPLFAEAAE